MSLKEESRMREEKKEKKLVHLKSSSIGTLPASVLSVIQK